MQTERTRIYIFAKLLLLALLCTAGLASAQEVLPSPDMNPGDVHYEMIPLPPVTEVGYAWELLPPTDPLLEAPSSTATEAEEVQPLEVIEGEEKKEAEGEAEGEEKGEEVKSELEIPLEEQSLWYFWRLWEAGYELGVNGSVGNSDTHTWRTAFRAKRATDISVLTASVDYKKSMDQSTTTADRLYHEWRAEFPNKKNKWSWYLHGTVEFDAFRAYDARVTEDNGVGYQWYKTDTGSFITRVGAGMSREFGGPNDEWVPEGVLGAVYEHQLTKRQKLALSSEFFFDWTEFGENRLNTKADWEVILDKEAALSLKVSLINRYDSTPDGKKPNDLDYSTVLLWSF